jgi:hypothetical protein
MAGVLAGLPALCANGLLSGLGRHLRRVPPANLHELTM